MSYANRRLRNTVYMWLAIGAAVIGLFFLFVILATLLYKGFTAIQPEMFLESTPPPGDKPIPACTSTTTTTPSGPHSSGSRQTTASVKSPSHT